MKNLTEKQASRLAKVVEKYPHFTFTVFNTNAERETVAPWGVGVTNNPTDLSKAYAAKPKTKNGIKSQFAHTALGHAELTSAMKAASAALWHRQPILDA